jgi:hypothetical protein
MARSDGLGTKGEGVGGNFGLRISNFELLDGMFAVCWHDQEAVRGHRSSVVRK